MKVADNEALAEHCINGVDGPENHHRSYLFEAPVELGDPRLAHVNAATVANQASGQPALAFRMSLARLDARTAVQVRERLERRAAKRTLGIADVLEAGVAGAVAFSIESPPPGKRLAEKLADGRRFTPSETVTLIRTIGERLERAGVRHGQLSSALIWLDETAVPTLAGFSFIEPDPGADVVDLAGLAFETLNGVRFDPTVFDLPAGVRHERIREALPGLTAQFAGAIANGTGGLFSTITELVTALEDAAAGSAADLAAAAHEAVSAKDLHAAELFLDLGRRYVPDNPELTAVALRMSPGASRSEGLNPLIDNDELFDPASEQARFLAALKASIPEVSTQKPKLPWVAIAAGLLGMFAIVTVLAVVVMQAR